MAWRRPWAWQVVPACAAVLVVTSACGVLRGNGDAMRDCGLSVVWHDHQYLGLGYVLRSPQTYDDVVAPRPGPTIGSGYIPQCPGDDHGTPAKVLSIRSVPTSAAVMARYTADGTEPILCIRKGHPVPARLLEPG